MVAINAQGEIYMPYDGKREQNPGNNTSQKGNKSVKTSMRPY